MEFDFYLKLRCTSHTLIHISNDSVARKKTNYQLHQATGERSILHWWYTIMTNGTLNSVHDPGARYDYGNNLVVDL